MTDSNRRHPRCKRDALPAELIALNFFNIINSLNSNGASSWYIADATLLKSMN